MTTLPVITSQLESQFNGEENYLNNDEIERPCSWNEIPEKYKNNEGNNEIVLMSCSFSIEDEENPDQIDKLGKKSERVLHSLTVAVSASGIICRYSTLLFGLGLFLGLLFMMALLIVLLVDPRDYLSSMTNPLQIQQPIRLRGAAENPSIIGSWKGVYEGQLN